MDHISVQMNSIGAWQDDCAEPVKNSVANYAVLLSLAVLYTQLYKFLFGLIVSYALSDFYTITIL